MSHLRALMLRPGIILFVVLLGIIALVIPTLSRSALQAQETCGIAPPPHLAIGGRAMVTISAGETLRLRNAPGLDGESSGSLNNRSEINVLDGPVCADNYYWWQVQLDDGTTGWAAEGSPDFYFLTQTRAPVPTADTGDTTCENVLPPIGETGEQVTVTHAGQPLEARELPAQGAGINSTWWAGTTFTLLEGPSCGNGIWWWRVTLPDGSAAVWVPQGDSTQYYLALVVPTPTATATVTPSATATITPSFTSTAPPTLTVTPSVTNTPTATATATATLTPSHTPTTTYTPSLTLPPSDTPTITNTPQPTSTPRPSLTPSPTLDTLCWYAPLPRLAAGSGGQVVQHVGSLRLRALPAVGAGEVAMLLPGAAFTVLEGPTCNSGYYWYSVELDDGLSGWVAEGEDTTYWLEPVAAANTLKERACLAWGDNHGLHLTINETQIDLSTTSTGHVTDVAFSPNGRFLATNQQHANSASDRLAVYDLTTHEVITTTSVTALNATAQTGTTLRWLPDNSGLMITEQTNNGLLSWQLTLPNQVIHHPLLDDWQVADITPDGQLVLLRSDQWQASLYDPAAQTFTSIQLPASPPHTGEAFITVARLTAEQLVLLYGNTASDETTLKWNSTIALPSGEATHTQLGLPVSQLAWTADGSMAAYTLTTGSLWLAENLDDVGNLLLPYSAGEVAGLRFNWSLVGQALLYDNSFEPNTLPTVLDLETSTSTAIEPLDDTSIWTYHWLDGTTLLAATDNASQALVNQPTHEAFWLLDPIEETTSPLLTLDNTVFGSYDVQPDGCFTPAE